MTVGIPPLTRRRLALVRSAPTRADVHGAPGFTLLEVLVSLTIFALAVVVLGSTYLNILNSYEAVSRGVQIDEDFAFAREIVLKEADRKKLEEGGQFEAPGNRQVDWSVVIESTNIADLFAVTFICQITDPLRPQPERIEQRFRLLRPTWSIDPSERGLLKEDAKTRIYEIQGKQPQR